MLHYKGIIADQPGIKAKSIGSTHKTIIETLLFYDDELCDESSCILVQDQLQEHFKSEHEDVHIQVYYDKEDNRVIIGMTIFFDNEEDKSKLPKYKTSFEKFYNKTFSNPTNMIN
jgi:hypothetical protein